MGIFSRFRDIVTSNINAMLDKAEEPEKLIKLMIQEMEDTLCEIKASCAGAMASRARVTRGLSEAREKSEKWSKKAELALSKGREDLAREALMEKKAYQTEIENLDKETVQFSDLIERYQSDIAQLEEKLTGARQKHRVLIQRHIQADKSVKAQKTIRQVHSSDAFARFDHFENRIERMEADADLVNYTTKSNLDDEFQKLEQDEDIEKELAELKSKLAKDEEDEVK